MYINVMKCNEMYINVRKLGMDIFSEPAWNLTMGRVHSCFGPHEIWDDLYQCVPQVDLDSITFIFTMWCLRSILSNALGYPSRLGRGNRLQAMLWSVVRIHKLRA